MYICNNVWEVSGNYLWEVSDLLHICVYEWATCWLKMPSLVESLSEPDYVAQCRLSPLTERLSWRVLTCLDGYSISQFVPLNRDIRDISEPTAKTIRFLCEFLMQISREGNSSVEVDENEMSSLVQVCCERDCAAQSRLHPLTWHLSWRVLLFLDPMSISQFVPLNSDIAEVSQHTAHTIFTILRFLFKGYSSVDLCLRMIEIDPFFPFIGVFSVRQMYY